MTSLHDITEQIEHEATRLAEDTVGVQILGAKDMIDNIGAGSMLAQDLTSIFIRQANLALRDYAELAIHGGDARSAMMNWAGNRIVHRSEGMLEATRAVTTELERLRDAHDAMWAGFREVM